MRRLIIYFFFLISFYSFSQVNYSEHISPIIYNNCTECHRDGQSGPMSFTNYLEVASLGSMIEYVTQTEYMPPWHADTEYSNFIGERELTDEEIDLIAEWVSNGMPQGDPSLEADIPNFPEGSSIGDPDLVLEMSESYLIEGNNQDDYRVFVFSTNFTEDKDLKSIEFIPGNYEVVHHVLVNIDTEGECAALDAATPEYGYECASGFCTGSIPFLATGYVPGMAPPVWNNDVGLKLPAGADIAIQIHYAPSPIDEYDQSKINLFFKDEPIEREVDVFTMIDIGLAIPANQIYTNYKSFEIDTDISILSVLPHMHLIGKSWLVYAENNEDTIPIISIPNWDFNWQNFYQPEYMLKIPAGYTIHAYATYDNTSNNPLNPNSPPQDMFWCDYTTCEMFFLPFSYVLYQEGDENIYLGDPEDLGCTDLEACNYSPYAILDDESCEYPDLYYDCDGNCLNDVDNDNICDELECAVVDCAEEYECILGECICINDVDEDGVCDENEIYGCTDNTACNYYSMATQDDGSCFYAEEYYDCDGNCLNDADEDGICDETECFTVFCMEWYECILGDCVCISDIDLDEVCDEYDNCVDVYNPYQEDSNNDGVGDACDLSNLEDIVKNKTLIQVTDLLGRNVNYKSVKKHIFLYHYSDGTVIKSFQF